ncbi:hypothetical protein AMTRI_Chr08g210610 [Amborella trichopoda]
MEHSIEIGPVTTANPSMTKENDEENNVSIYEPCDDSFALVDALLTNRADLVELRPNLCMEIGCGSGYVIALLAIMLASQGRTWVHYMATDLYEVAAQVTCKTLVAHGVHAESEEVGCHGIAASWVGGEHGRRVIDCILLVVQHLLSIRGPFYLVTLTANNPLEICLMMREKGYDSWIILQRSTEEKSLHVLKFWRLRTHPQRESDIANASSNSSYFTLCHWAFRRGR